MFSTQLHLQYERERRADLIRAARRHRPVTQVAAPRPGRRSHPRRRWAHRTSLGLLLAALTVALSASPAAGISDGTLDTANSFSNVGIVEIFDDSGVWWYGTGTLVAPNVVLTAGHVLDMTGTPFTAANVRVSFDPLPPWPWVADPLGTSAWYYGSAIAVHENWTWAYTQGNSKRGLLADDVALLWLQEPVIGITPASIAGADALDQLDLKSEQFTVAGYGLTQFVVGAGPAWRNPQRQAEWNGRNFRNVEVISEHEAYSDRFVKFEGSICFGDSGGPLFDDGTVMAVNTWAGGWRCEAPSYAFRLDSPSAQAFLNAHLG